MTNRLTGSPACVVVGEADMGAQMRRMLEQEGQDVKDSGLLYKPDGAHDLICVDHRRRRITRKKDITKQ